MKLHPVGERVLVEPVKEREKTSSSGLYLPAVKSEAKEGIVRGVPKEGGPILLGERVIFHRASGVGVGDSGYLVLDVKEILAVYEGG